jgi:hypothetical protein
MTSNLLEVNSHSKQAFINMLCEKLNEHDTRYKNAVDDADLLIAQTAADRQKSL